MNLELIKVKTALTNILDNLEKKHNKNNNLNKELFDLKIVLDYMENIINKK
jgi:hypothetical protein